MGTWIETIFNLFFIINVNVVPLVGTWIETTRLDAESNASPSFPSWERGLKPDLVRVVNKGYSSFPSWERGLKR